MTAVVIARYAGEDPRAIVDLILPIQREEFGVPVTLADQPDLLDIAGFYQVDGGEFWLAKHDDRVIGTIALKAFGGEGALRKMFVAAPFRGRAWSVGDRLLAALLAHARAHGMAAITLGTTERFHAAHRFYEKNGFAPIAADDLPHGFPRVAVDTRFYRLSL